MGEAFPLLVGTHDYGESFAEDFWKPCLSAGVVLSVLYLSDEGGV